MDRSSTINLIKEVYEKNEYGVSVPVRSKRQVFAEVTSVTGSEFFQAFQSNVKPEIRFIIFAYDYDDEQLIEYNGKLYSVYRTYMSKNDSLELMAERKVGNG